MCEKGKKSEDKKEIKSLFSWTKIAGILRKKSSYFLVVLLLTTCFGVQVLHVIIPPYITTKSLDIQ